MRSHRLTRLSLVLAGCVLALGAGCQSVGPTYEQTRDGVNSTDVNPNRLAYTDDSGQETVSSSGPTYRTTIDPDGTIQAIGGGLASREFIVPGKLMVRSNTDIDGHVDELYGADGALIAKGFQITTRTTEPTKAANEALEQWVAALAVVTPEQRMALEAQVKGMVDGANAIMPTLGDILRQLVLPGS
jgi:hypothetical protein